MHKPVYFCTQMRRKIFVVDDSNTIADQLVDLSEKASQSLDFVQIETGEIYNQSREFSPLYILIDSSVFNNGNTRALKSLKQDPKTLEIPVILITEKIEPEKIK